MLGTWPHGKEEKGAAIKDFLIHLWFGVDVAVKSLSLFE